jgi:hypothetical protein
MMHTTRRVLLVAAFAILVTSGAAPACRAADDSIVSSFAPSAEGSPASSSATNQLPTQYTGPEGASSFVLPPPPAYSAACEGWIGSPLLDRPDAAGPGFFVNVESSVLWVQFGNELVGGTAPHDNVGFPATSGLPITGDIVRFPGNEFNVTASPRVELGYRLPDGFGEFRLGYRSLAASGSDTVLVAPPDANDNLGRASQTGRLDINMLDFDWGTREFSLGSCWELRTAVGVRYATAFLDSEVTFLNPVTVTGNPFGTGPFTRLSQSEALSNHFLGAHAVLEVGRKLWIPGLALFGRLDGAGMYGRVHQTFRETFVQAPGSTQQEVGNGLGTPMLATEVGLSYDVPRWNHSRFLVGYQHEDWWYFGRGDNDLSFGTLSAQGIFLRAEFNF